jgi:hypothetical protein
MGYLYELYLLHKNDEVILKKAYTMVKKFKTKGYDLDGRIILYTESEGFTDFDERNGFISEEHYEQLADYEVKAKKLSDKELVEITFKHLKIRADEREKARASARQPYTTYSEKDVKDLADSFARGVSAAAKKAREWGEVEPVGPAADYNSDTSSKGSGRESGGGTDRKKMKKSKRRTMRRYKY